MPELSPLTPRTTIGYGIGEMSKEIPGSILVFFLLYFLTNVAGLSPSLAGTVLLLGKSWDAINDPLIGWLSDRTQSKLGRRFPWILGGALPLGLSFWLLWQTPNFGATWHQFSYYTGAMILLYASLTAIAIPHATLGAELTQTYHERTQLISVKASFSIGSSILGLLIAQLIFSMGFDQAERYRILGTIVGIIVVIAAGLCVWSTAPRYWQIQRIRPAPNPRKTLGLESQLLMALRLRPFLIVMGIYLCSWIGLQVTAGILQYYVVDYLQLSDQHFTQLILVIQGTALTMMLFWSNVAQRIGKRAVYCCGIPLTITAQLGLSLLHPDNLVALYGLGFLAGLGLSVAYLVPWSMLPDVLDLDELLTGLRREGIFCGIVVQLEKFGTAFAIFLVGKVLDQAGYVTQRGPEVLPQPESALNAIRWLLGPIPALILMGGIVIAVTYPIDRDRHQAILQQLKQKKAMSQ